jgi:hypothetical protein
MSLLRRAVRVRLLGHRFITGEIHIPAGHSLAGFLSSKQIFLNLTEVRRDEDPEGMVLPHISVRLSRILWVEPLEEALHLSTAALPSEEERSVELEVDDGLRLQVSLNVARETRMTDYLDANTAFLPLWDVRAEGEDGTVHRVALSHGAIQVIRELEATDPRKRS